MRVSSGGRENNGYLEYTQMFPLSKYFLLTIRAIFIYTIWQNSICLNEILVNARLTELLPLEFIYPNFISYYTNEK